MTTPVEIRRGSEWVPQDGRDRATGRHVLVTHAPATMDGLVGYWSYSKDGRRRWTSTTYRGFCRRYTRKDTES